MRCYFILALKMSTMIRYIISVNETVLRTSLEFLFFKNLSLKKILRFSKWTSHLGNMSIVINFILFYFGIKIWVLTYN